MSLPVSERRALERIERSLQASEPRLASKFAMFTRLVTADGPIGRERISVRRIGNGFHVIALISVAVAMLIAGLVLSGTYHRGGGCIRTRGPVATAAPPASCGLGVRIPQDRG